MSTVRQSTGKQLALLSGLKFWNQGISLVKTMVISRMFSLTEYGIYTKILLILDFAFAILVLNLPSCASYFISKSADKKGKRNFIYTFYWLCTMVGILMGFILYFSAPLLGKALNCPQLVEYRWYLLVTSLTQVIFKASTYVLTSQGKSDVAVKISFGSSLLLLLGLFIAYQSTDSFFICLVLMLSVEVVQTILGYGVGIKSWGGIHKVLHREVRFDSSLIRKIYAYIVPVGLSSLVLIINTRIDKILVSTASSSAYYAIYANASKELPVAALSVAVSSVIIPKLVKLMRTEQTDIAIDTWKHALVFVTTLSLLLLTGTQLFAPEVMSIIYSAKYVEGVNIFRIYLFLIPFHCIEFTLLLSALGETKYIFKSAIISMTVNVILDFLLLYLIGFEGLGIATVIATFIMISFQLYYSARCMKVTIRTLVPFRKLGQIIAINVLFMIIFKIIQEALPLEHFISGVGEAVILGVIWSALYLLTQRKKLTAEWRGLNYGD